MCNARKVLLHAVAAITAMGVAAAPAAALEVRDEATGRHCGTVTPAPNGHGSGSGGCLFGVTNEGRTEFGSPLGMIDCDTTFIGRIGENGSGFIFGQNLFNCSPNTADECKESGVPDNWPIELTSETTMEWSICAVLFGFLTMNCHIAPVSFSQVSHTEGELFVSEHLDCENDPNYSIRSHWVTDAPAPGWEVLH